MSTSTDNNAYWLDDGRPLMMSCSAAAFSPAHRSPSTFTAASTGARLSGPRQSRMMPPPSTSALRVPRTRLSADSTESLNLPPMLDPGTKGGAIVVTTLLMLIPLTTYYGLTGVFHWDEQTAGNLASGSFCVISILLWTGSYLFRVGTKDMTYTKQLKSYEDAVIAKRLEELSEDEVVALMDEMDRT